MDKEVFIYIYIHMYIWIDIQWNIIQSLKTQQNTICDNMDGPWGQYAKWNKSDRGKILSQLYVESKKKTQTIKTPHQIHTKRSNL